MTMKEHKSELQQKVITLEHALNQARYELSERAVEVRNSRAFFSVFVLCCCCFVFLCVICLHKSDYEEKIFYGKEQEGIQQQQQIHLLPNVKEFNSPALILNFTPWIRDSRYWAWFLKG